MTKPRILVGLKNGDLLASMISEKSIISSNLEVPMFSPNLKVWRTSRNDKYLVTGNIGINSALVETANNFPRFSIIKKKGETKEEILERVKKKGSKLIQKIANAGKKEAPENPGLVSNGKPACFHTNDLVFKQDVVQNKGESSSAVMHPITVDQASECGSASEENQVQTELSVMWDDGLDFSRL